MPWKTHSLLEARQRFVQAALRDRRSVAKLCRDFQISRKTGFKWLKRFRLLGGPGLADRGRRPRRSPHRTSERWLEALVEVRRKHPYWGGKKIYAYLRRKHSRGRLPRPRTITGWLGRLKLVRRRNLGAPNGPRLPRPDWQVPQAPNDVWTADFKGWFRTRNGQRVDPLTVRDLFSRLILGIDLPGYRHEPVQRSFQKLFRRYGLPKVIQVDHGAPFAGDGALNLSRLSAWWLRLGIRVQFTRKARPQDNGAHEQMHRIYKAELTSPPAATPRGQRWRTTRWMADYNEERPHEALGQRVPGMLYQKSRQRYRRRLPPLEYPANWWRRRVTACGYIRWRGRLRVIGRAFGKNFVGIKPLAKGVQEVYFGTQLVGLLIDSDSSGLRPAHWSKSARTKTKP